MAPGATMKRTVRTATGPMLAAFLVLAGIVAVPAESRAVDLEKID